MQAWLFDGVCALVRAGVPDALIHSILTDERFKISESVLEKANASKYALQQIINAKLITAEPRLDEMNSRYFCVQSVGGKFRICEEINDPVLERARLHMQDKANFCNAHENIKVGKKKLGAWWLEHPRRRQYKRIVLLPGQNTPEDYNLWRGFSFEPNPGTRHNSYLDHLRSNICRGDPELYTYLVGYMALGVQRPNERGHVAVVLRGGRGTGKSSAIQHYGRLFGCHYLSVFDAKHLVGHFNGHLRNCIVLLADEAFFAGDKKHESVLKALITEQELVIENKGLDVDNSPNLIHLFMASNDKWVVPAGLSERRFFVLDVGDERKQDIDYFKGIASDLKAGGYANLLHFLLTYDLTGFEPRHVPQTAALAEQKRATAEEWLKPILDMAAEGVAPDHDDFKPANEACWVSVHGLLEAVGRLPPKKVDEMKVAEALRQLVCLDAHGRPITRRMTVACYSERPLNQPVIPEIPQLGENPIVRPTKLVSRKMYKLKSLQEVRTALSEYGMDYDEGISDWQLHGVDRRCKKATGEDQPM